MGCEHKRIKSVNCVISCMDCGEVLPIDYIIGRERIAAQKAAESAPEAKAEDNTTAHAEAAETPEKGQKKATGRKPRKGSENK